MCTKKSLFIFVKILLGFYLVSAHLNTLFSLENSSATLDPTPSSPPAPAITNHSEEKSSNASKTVTNGEEATPSTPIPEKIPSVAPAAATASSTTIDAEAKSSNPATPSAVTDSAAEQATPSPSIETDSVINPSTSTASSTDAETVSPENDSDQSFLSAPAASSSPNKMETLPTNVSVPSTQRQSAGAIYFFGEAGNYNLRGGATAGVNFTPCQRFKITGEYLTQDLKYSFSEHHERKWVSQYAIGLEYQWLLKGSAFQTIYLGAAYEHAFNRNVEMHPPAFSAISKERIAGSNGLLSFLGTTVSLWKCAYLSADLNYDYVKFNERFHHKSVNKGWGASFLLMQQLPNNFSIDVGSAFRDVFNDYSIAVRWSDLFNSFGLNIGLFGHFADGKHGVRDILTGGLQFGISFGGKGNKCCRSDLSRCEAKSFCDLGNWVMKPAVYVPVVLNKKEILATTCCTIAGAPGGIPNLDDGANFTYDVSPFFSSACPITYSLTFVTANLPPPGFSLTINPSTGLITGTNIDGTGAGVFITVTGVVTCGQVSQTFTFFN